MRHRATRPVIGLLLNLPRTTARRLGLAAGLPARTRVLGLLAAVLALGGVGYAVVASVEDGGTGPQAESSVPPGPSATAEPRGPGRQEPGTTVSPSGTPSPTARPEEPATPTPSKPEDSSSTGEPSPSAAEATDRPPSPALRTAAPSPREAASTAADDVPPETTVSHEVTGPGAALLMFSADETATFACSLDGAAYAPCASAVSYSELDPGWHTFTVRATDADGNVDDSPASTRWLSTPGGAEPSGDR
jgi:hypothetical protein